MPVTASPIHTIDSHTGGEPTRVVLAGGPDLGSGPLTDRLARFRTHHDHLRSAICCEPRGSEVVVGALLVPPTHPAAATGVLFFNDVGYLGMCGHGTIGVVQTLAHLGRITPGIHPIETPVGLVHAELLPSGAVRVRNVPSFRYRAAVPVHTPGFGTLTGDIAWGGNWFFLISNHAFALTLANRHELLRVTREVRDCLAQSGITGEHGAFIDHIELFGPPANPGNSSRNFVLCPGASFDRSPCGTGTSAKLACLHADGVLAPGEPWRQEGILGTHFTATYTLDGSTLIPTIEGRAWITAESHLHLDPSDPFRNGIPF